MRVLAAFAVLMLVGACQAPPAEMTEAEKAQIEAEVLQWAEAWLDAWVPETTEDRCTAVLALVHPNHVVRVGGGAPQRQAEWFDYCMGNQENWRGFNGSWTETSVRVLSPDAAVFLGSASGTWEHADGRTIRYPSGAQLLLVERSVDGWGMTIMQFSNGPSEVVEEG